MESSYAQQHAQKLTFCTKYADVIYIWDHRLYSTVDLPWRNVSHKAASKCVALGPALSFAWISKLVNRHGSMENELCLIAKSKTCVFIIMTIAMIYDKQRKLAAINKANGVSIGYSKWKAPTLEDEKV